MKLYLVRHGEAVSKNEDPLRPLSVSGKAEIRLVAEQIKSEQFLFLNHAGVYTDLAEEEAKVHLVETIEGVIRGTDIGYFSLLVEPGKRIEKRMR